MTRSLTAPRSVDNWKSELRIQSAGVLHTAGAGLVKMIAAALRIGAKRVYRMHEGEDANYLELLARVLDRIELEAGRERILPILRWLAGRYGHGIHAHGETAPTAEAIERQTGESIRASSEAHATVIQAAPSGFTDSEKRTAIERIDAAIAELQESRGLIEQSPTVSTN